MNIDDMNWDALEKNLNPEINKAKKSYKDERFWTLSRDENDRGAALIRLVPDPEGQAFIRVFNHAFQSFDPVTKKKRFFIKTSPQTIGEECPASDLWSALKNSGLKEGEEEAKFFSRKVQFYANIKIIKDPANPQNEGKIFLWKFGAKLKDKFMAALNPSEADRQMGEQPQELFHPLKGNNIKLKIKKAASGFFDYDDTTIENPSAIYADKAEAEADLKENSYVLNEFMKADSIDTIPELIKGIKYVTDVYEPKHLSKDMFNKLIAPVIGTKQVVTETPNDVAETTQPAFQEGQKITMDDEPVKVETPVQAEKPTTDIDNDPDLAFLQNM